MINKVVLALAASIFSVSAVFAAGESSVSTGEERLTDKSDAMASTENDAMASTETKKSFLARKAAMARKRFLDERARMARKRTARMEKKARRARRRMTVLEERARGAGRRMTVLEQRAKGAAIVRKRLLPGRARRRMGVMAEGRLPTGRAAEVAGKGDYKEAVGSKVLKEIKGAYARQQRKSAKIGEVMHDDETDEVSKDVNEDVDKE